MVGLYFVFCVMDTDTDTDTASVCGVLNLMDVCRCFLFRSMFDV